jgi:hypothetical protein
LCIKYNFAACIWKYNAKGGWYFVSLPVEISRDIRLHLKHFEEGWGRLKCKASIRELDWYTAIWYDTTHKTYLLPIKADVRRRLKLQIDDDVKVHLEV